jgi:hypothetical protein
VFINNASIGFYSSMVQDPQYRSRRVAVTSRYLRRAIRGGRHDHDGVADLCLSTRRQRVVRALIRSRRRRTIR